MNKFDLEKALAGGKVVTRDGREVTQLHAFKGVDSGQECIYAFLDGDVQNYFDGGIYNEDLNENPNDLFMAPKQLSGFVNVYLVRAHDTKEIADKEAGSNRVACIDLNQFTEGYGL